MNNPLDSFFKLGEKVTGNDPKKLMDWNYYLMLIMFFGFVTILVSNLYSFYQTQVFSYLGWSIVMLAILWFQYQGLAQLYFTRRMLRNPQNEVIQSQEEMLKEFFKDENKV